MSIKPLPLFAVVSICLMVGIMTPSASVANPPQDVRLSYDAKSQMLSVTITHPSFFPGFHYVKSVEIKKNGAVVGGYQYDKQPDEKTFVYSYPLAVASGDALAVKASCSLYGSRSADLIIGK